MGVSVQYHRYSQTTTLPINPNRPEKSLPSATGCEDDHNSYISQKRCEGILMCGCVHETKGLKPRGFSALVTTLALSILLAGHLWAQSPSTGALIGRTQEPSGAAIPGVKIQIIGRGTDVTLSATSDEKGRFGFQLLAPGNYGLQAVKASFDPLQLDDINISVTETLRIELHLQIARH
jgi:hypothetical protein